MQVKVKIYSHYFSVELAEKKISYSLFGFSKQFVQWGLVKEQGRFVRAPVKNFYLQSIDQCTLRFHVGFLRLFKDYIKTTNINQAEIEWEYVKYPEAVKIDFEIFDHFKPREKQLSAIEYITNLIPENPPLPTQKHSNCKFLGLQTGKGKGKVSMFSIKKIGERVVIIIKPMYIEKWCIELIEVFAIDKEDIMVIGGGPQLKKFLNMVENGDMDAKFIIVSNSTFRNWLTEYEEFEEETLDNGYPCLPHDFFGFVGAGVRLIDELHQDFHFNFKLDLYTNIHMSISMSATLVSDDRFISKMQTGMHPLDQRSEEQEYDRYCAAISYLYRFRTPDRIRLSSWGSTMYSHIELENSVLKHVPTCMRYMNMINEVIKMTFIKGYEPGYKLMVFCGSVKMCTMLVEYLRNKYPRFDVRRYCEEDPFENVIKPDIRVSTLISAGAAVDIKNLYTTILTTAISSTSSNLQSLGRTRQMDDGNTPIFAYISCEDFDKHMEYEQKKREILSTKAASFRVDYIREPV